MEFVMLKTGDPCPCCGKPILTEDPDKLLALSLINKLLEEGNGEKSFCEKD